MVVANRCCHYCGMVWMLCAGIVMSHVTYRMVQKYRAVSIDSCMLVVALCCNPFIATKDKDRLFARIVGAGRRAESTPCQIIIAVGLHKLSRIISPALFFRILNNDLAPALQTTVLTANLCSFFFKLVVAGFSGPRQLYRNADERRCDACRQQPVVSADDD